MADQFTSLWYNLLQEKVLKNWLDGLLGGLEEAPGN